MTPEKRLVTAAEAAQMLAIDRGEVYALARDGLLTKRYIGKGTREFRIEVASIDEYVASLPTDPAVSA